MPGTTRAASMRAPALMRTRRMKPTALVVPERAQEHVDRERAGAGDQDAQRHGDEHEVELEAVALAGRAREVEEEAVPAVHLRDGDQHHGDEADRGGPHEEAGHHGEPAEKLDERRHHRGGRRHLHVLLERLDGGLESWPAEHLLPAVCDEDDAEGHAHDRARPRGIRPEDQVEGVVHGILRVVNGVRSRTARRPRVYTMVKGHPRRVPLFSSIFVTLVLVLALARAAPAIEMLGDITVEPTMVKGPPTAPVTIVEFSDYQ